MRQRDDEMTVPAAELAAVDLPGAAEVERGQSLLARISTEVVKTFKEYYGKGPTNISRRPKPNRSASTRKQAHGRSTTGVMPRGITGAAVKRSRRQPLPLSERIGS
jgi:hypothetical protein